MRKDLVYISNLKDHVGEVITLAGWMYNKRSSGKLWFLILRDGTGIVQCVISKKEVSPEIFSYKDQLTQESSISVTGVVNADDRAPGGYEIWVNTIKLEQIAQEYPISLKDHGTDFLMDHRHLWIRTPRQNAILRIRHEIIRAIRDFMMTAILCWLMPQFSHPMLLKGLPRYLKRNILAANPI